MSKERISMGVYGEEQAVALLESEGYTILDRNFRCRSGEIDIVARDGEYLCFIEVKMRHGTGFMQPAQAVSGRKAHYIRNVAQYYLLTHGYSENMFEPYVRFDVVEVLEGDPCRINLIKNAFY